MSNIRNSNCWWITYVRFEGSIQENMLVTCDSIEQAINHVESEIQSCKVKKVESYGPCVVLV